MPETLRIKADSASKIYDGTPLVKNTYTSSGLSEGDTVTVKVTGSQTAVGTSNNVPSNAVVYDSEGQDVTENYEITYENGTLEVTENVLMGMLKVDLGISVSTYDTRLNQYIYVAKRNIKSEGVQTLDDTKLEDMQLIVMYAAWMWRKRDLSAGKYGAGTAMPSMLRYTLNNRIFAEKMGGDSSD